MGLFKGFSKKMCSKWPNDLAQLVQPDQNGLAQMARLAWSDLGQDPSPTHSLSLTPLSLSLLCPHKHAPRATNGAAAPPPIRGRLRPSPVTGEISQSFALDSSRK